MKKGAGIALLAIASIYQLNKINKRRNQNKLIDVEIRRELFTRSEIESAKRSPVQIVKDAKLKRELKHLEVTSQGNTNSSAVGVQSEELAEVNGANLESDDQIQVEDDVSVRSFDDVQTEVRAQIEQGDLDESETAESTVVYIVGKGQRYHLTKDCRGVKKGAELTELTLEDAIDKGYSLCGWESK